LHIPTLGDPQIRPDGRAFAYVLRSLDGNTWRSTVYLAPIPTGAARAVATGTHPRWSPDSALLAYLDAHTDHQVHVYDLAQRSSRAVTHSPSPIATYCWTPDGRGIAYLAADTGPAPDPIVADRDYRYSRIYIQPVAGDEPRRLTTADRHVVSFALSPDGTRAVYAAQPTPRNRDSFDVDLYELDLRTLAEKPLVTQPGRDSDPSYSPDGKWIAFPSQGGTLNYFAARHVALSPSGGCPIRYLTKATSVPLDAFRGGNSFSWSPDGRTLCYTAGHGVRDYLVRQDLSTGRIERVTDRVASAPSFTADLTRAVLLQASASRPPEVTLLEMGPDARPTESRLTHIGDYLSEYPAVRSKVVSWKSRDGLPIEGVLFLPFDYQPGRRAPSSWSYMEARPASRSIRFPFRARTRRRLSCKMVLRSCFRTFGGPRITARSSA
jgi:Tol biopolymer transport system component